jgi:hypothetical protein
MSEFAAMPTMDVWYARLELQEIFDRWARAAGSKRIAMARRDLAKAEAKDSLKAFGKLTRVVDGKRRIVSDPPLIVPVEELVPSEAHDLVAETFRSLLRTYSRTLPRDRRRLLQRFDYQHATREIRSSCRRRRRGPLCSSPSSARPNTRTRDSVSSRDSG